MRICQGIVFLLLACLAAGLTSCTSAPGMRRGPLPAEVTFWQPWLLYSSGSPYQRIHVEVDAVAGSEPPQAWLDALQRYLSIRCNKPGGVKVVRSSVIPAREAAGSSQTALALKYINGPPAGAAFLYVLYYNSALNPTMKRSNPHAVVFPYPCAIFVDRDYNEAGFGDRMGELILIHEAGHLTGAARSTSHGDGAHCANRRCLMSPAFEYFPAPAGSGIPLTLQGAFCQDCEADLARARSTPAARNLSFAGPMLVREEAGYSVFSLPNCVHLHLGTRQSFPEAQIRKAILAAGTGPLLAREGFILSISASGDTATVTRAAEAAGRDPAAPVRTAADLMRKRLETGVFSPPPGGTLVDPG